MLPEFPSPPKQTEHRPHRTDIDALRVFAIFAVVLFHGALIPGGYIGVDVFFVISGFLMALIIQQGLDAGRFTFTDFYARRARRIFPAFVAVLAIAGFAGCFLMLPADIRGLGRSVVAAAQFRSNFFFQDNASGYFTADAVQFEPLLHTWSLSVEMQFYLVFPILLWAVGKYGRRYVPFAIAALVALSLWHSQQMLSAHPQYSFYMLPSRMWELLAGALVYYLPPLQVWRRAVFVLAVALLFGPAFFYKDGLDFPGLAALPPVLGACLVLLARPGAVSSDGVIASAFSHPVTAGLANLSYSFYLWHWPIFVFARYNYGEVLPVWASILLLAVSLLLAALVYRFVERPFLRTKAPAKKTLCLQLALLVSLFLTGALIRYAVPPVVHRLLPANVIALYEGRTDMKRSDCLPYKDVAAGRIGAASECHVGDPATTPEFIVWGDSFARMWLPAFEAQGMAQHLAGLKSVRSACSPASSINDTRQAECEQFNRDTLTYILAHKQLKTVVMVANWRPSEKLADDIAQIASKLVEDGRAVYFVNPPPRPGYQVPRALAISELRGLPRPERPSADLYRKQTAALEKSLEPVREKYGLKIVALEQALCPDSECRIEENGRALYADATHLSGYAARKYRHVLDGVFQHIEGQKP